MDVVVVGCWVGLHWNVGNAWRSWSHMCSSWYFPRFLLRGVLNTDEHGFLDGPGLAVYLLVYNVKLVGVHRVSCGGSVEVYGGGGLEMFLDSFPQGSARFTNLGAGAIYVGALALVDNACLTGFGILILWIS